MNLNFLLNFLVSDLTDPDLLNSNYEAGIIKLNYYLNDTLKPL